MLELKNSYSDKVILGVNTGHDGGACILAGNRLVAISEERLTRRKRPRFWFSSTSFLMAGNRYSKRRHTESMTLGRRLHISYAYLWRAGMIMLFVWLNWTNRLLRQYRLKH